MDINTSLHIACMLGDESRVKHLLSRGAHRNAENASGTTALELADFLHRVEIVKLLLHDVNIKEVGGYELFKAIRMDHATVVRALLEMGVREELLEDGGFFRGVLVMACCVSNTGVLDVLIRYGPGLEVRPIMDVLIQCAVTAGNLEVVDGIREIVRCERELQGSFMVRYSALEACGYVKLTLLGLYGGQLSSSVRLSERDRAIIVRGSPWMGPSFDPNRGRFFDTIRWTGLSVIAKHC